ncbi:hypothetical protein [Tatumella ptyseos]|uniref:Uncharacterized protein n=1 Tax=Tatumella ptyseos TaxID=82987 RepID=A0A2X5RF88_9GAMM|nr:Uncharacterised protein [Tatumella ptyseos]
MDRLPAFQLRLTRVAGHAQRVERINTFLQQYNIQPDADIEFLPKPLSATGWRAVPVSPAISSNVW